MENTVALAIAALEAIEAPKHRQPAKGENGLFDGLLAQTQQAKDEETYAAIMAAARERVARAERELKPGKQRLIVYAYLADLHECRQSVAPALDKYRKALAKAESARKKSRMQKL